MINLILHYQKNGLKYSLKHVDLENVITEVTIENFENIIKYCDFDFPKTMENYIVDLRKNINENKKHSALLGLRVCRMLFV